MAEAVLAYHGMSNEERESESGRKIIKSLTRSKLQIEEVAEEWQTLCYHKQQILASIRNLFRKQVFGQGKNRRVAYSTMKISGQHDAKEVCFVPAGMTVQPLTVSTEVLKRAWRLEKPNMLLKIDCGSRHPAAIATPELIDLPDFDQLKKAAHVSVEQRQKKGATLSAEQRQCLIHEQINMHLKNSISNEVLPAILDSALKINNWIVIDRSNSTASSATAELLIEMSLGISQQTKPTVLVFDSITRYQNFKPSRVVNMQLLEICRVLSNCGSCDDARDVTDSPGLYKTSDFSEWESYHIRESDDDPMLPSTSSASSAKSEAEKEKMILQREGNRRLPRTPEDAMVNVDDDGRKCRTSDGRPLITPEVKWLYHYRQYQFNAGTHYVIFENAADSAFSMESNGVPWRQGYIFANGGNLSFDRIQQCLSSGMPTVMLYNTGGVAQTFASLHKWCVTRNVFIEDECTRKGIDSKSAILARTEVVSKEPWTRRIGISTVSQLQNLAKRAPETMRKSVAVVNVLFANPEQIVDKVTACFAATGHGLPELGLGTAEEDVVLHAWKRHMTFVENAQRYRRWGDICFYFSIALTLVSATFAILITKEEYTNGIQNALEQHLGKHLQVDFGVLDFCKKLLLVIPVTTSVLAAVVGKKRFLKKWAALTAASAQIVAEIYKFRLLVLDYDPQYSAEKKEGEEDEEEPEGDGKNGGQKQAEVFNARELFVQRFEQVIKFALDNVGEDSLKLPDASQFDFRNETQKHDFKQELRWYVPKKVLGGNFKDPGVRPTAHAQGKGIRKSSCPGFCYRRRGAKLIHPVGSHRADVEEGEVTDDFQCEHDDFVSPMVIESYIEYRAKLVLNQLEDTCPPLAKKLSDLETLVILIGAVGTLLAALDQARWVALTVAIGTSVTNVIQHEMLQQRLHSTNSSLREIHANQIRMDSLSIVSKRTQDMKGRCVDAVETAVLETVTAWTGMTARPSL
jgi:hypothetical protein